MCEKLKILEENCSIRLTVKLVLDNVVEYFQEEKHEMMVSWRREYKPRSAEGL